MSNEPSPRPWREDNYCIYDANGKIVACISSTTNNADARLIVAAVNNHEWLVKHNRLNAESVCELIDERDRLVAALEVEKKSYDELGSVLSDKARNYEDVIAYHMRTEEGLRDIVRRLTEYADAVTGYRPPAIEVVSSEHPAWMFDGASLLREARAALGEGEK